MIQALKDDDSGLRTEAAYALGDIKDTRAMEPLIQTLGDKNSDVRATAVKALAEIGNPQ